MVSLVEYEKITMKQFVGLSIIDPVTMLPATGYTWSQVASEYRFLHEVAFGA